MAKYDPKKDKTLVEKKVNFGLYDIVIGLYQYNGGDIKVGMKRIVPTASGHPRYNSIGRMTLEEYSTITNELAKLMNGLKKWKTLQQEIKVSLSV